MSSRGSLPELFWNVAGTHPERRDCPALPGARRASLVEESPGLPLAYRWNTSANTPRCRRRAGPRSQYYSTCKKHTAPLKSCRHTSDSRRAFSFPQEQDSREPSDSTEKLTPYQSSWVEVWLVLPSPHHGCWQRKVRLHCEPARLGGSHARARLPPRSAAALDALPVHGGPNDARGHVTSEEAPRWNRHPAPASARRHRTISRAPVLNPDPTPALPLASGSPRRLDARGANAALDLTTFAQSSAPTLGYRCARTSVRPGTRSWMPRPARLTVRRPRYTPCASALFEPSFAGTTELGGAFFQRAIASNGLGEHPRPAHEVYRAGACSRPAAATAVFYLIVVCAAATCACSGAGLPSGSFQRAVRNLPVYLVRLRPRLPRRTPRTTARRRLSNFSARHATVGVRSPHVSAHATDLASRCTRIRPGHSRLRSSRAHTRDPDYTPAMPLTPGSPDPWCPRNWPPDFSPLSMQIFTCRGKWDSQHSPRGWRSCTCKISATSDLSYYHLDLVQVHRRPTTAGLTRATHQRRIDVPWPTRPLMTSTRRAREGSVLPVRARGWLEGDGGCRGTGSTARAGRDCNAGFFGLGAPLLTRPTAQLLQPCHRAAPSHASPQVGSSGFAFGVRMQRPAAPPLVRPPLWTPYAPSVRTPAHSRHLSSPLACVGAPHRRCDALASALGGGAPSLVAFGGQVTSEHALTVELRQSASSPGLRVVQVNAHCHSPCTPDPVTAFFPVRAYTPRGRCFPTRPRIAPTMARRGGCCFTACPFLCATGWGAPCLSHQRPATAHRRPVLPACAQGRSPLAFLCPWPVVPTRGCLATGSPAPSTPHARILGGHVTPEEALRWIASLSPCARNRTPVRAELAARVIDPSRPFYMLLPPRVGGQPSASLASTRAPLDVLRPPQQE
ncbi:hypothetical protein B0H14DRAFT_3867067 [Mycena olivaceomarginata]|nr:hypothetical protein B0H14DRAFT_3867067 [Mycena olivaceomarginata]